MSDFGKGIWITKGRVEHKCAWCGEAILCGARHYRYVGRVEGEWQYWRMHAECESAYQDDDCGEFLPGENERPKA